MKAEDHYSEGIRIATTIKDLDGPSVNPLCHTRLYTHGRRVERALVLLHGFTNCPQQMDALGRQFYERGWNVFIPRYPRHGYSDRLNTSIAELRAEHLIALANRSAEVGAALGQRFTVAGLSLGYPRFSTHAYAALFQAGRRLVKAARSGAPKAHSFVVVTNAAEPRLDNRFTYRLIDSWRAHGANVETFEFPVADRLPHDLIDPGNAAQNNALVYPIVTRLIESP